MSTRRKYSISHSTPLLNCQPTICSAAFSPWIWYYNATPRWGINNFKTLLMAKNQELWWYFWDKKFSQVGPPKISVIFSFYLMVWFYYFIAHLFCTLFLSYPLCLLAFDCLCLCFWIVLMIYCFWPAPAFDLSSYHKSLFFYLTSMQCYQWISKEPLWSTLWVILLLPSLTNY